MKMKRASTSRTLVGLVGLVVTTSCADATAPLVPAPLTAVDAPAGYPPGALATTAPLANPLTEARAQLGKRLFFDARLSRTNEIACASCHHPEQAFSDPAAVSTGVDGRRGTRNAPALVNEAWGLSFFWDGRAASLEEQAGKPIENPLEMDLPLADAVARVATDDSYARAFADAYGGAPNEETLRFALASFVRTLVSGDSPYDRHLRGDDATYGAAAVRGEALFFSDRGACFHCHPAGALTNEGFFNDGSFVAGADGGRQLVTGRTGDLGKFKVPGLRNVAASAPYMHDGSVTTLAAVVEQYVLGGRAGHTSADPEIQSLTLSTDEKADLVAFLTALTDEAFLTNARFRL
jgi:cytochrome c peroxidase